MKPFDYDSLSYDELLKLRQQLLAQQQQSSAAPLTREGITAYDPGSDFFSRQNLGSMASNVGPSALNLGKTAASLVSEEGVKGMASMAGDVLRGIGDPVYGAQVVGPKILKGAGGIFKTLGERYGSMENIKRTAVEDPVGMALDVLPGAGAAMKVGGIATRGIGGALRTGIGQGIGLTSGKGGARALAGIEAGAAGKGEEFLQGARGQLTPYGLGEEVTTGLKEVERAAGKPKGDFMDSPAGAETVDISDLKKAVSGDLTQGGKGGLLARLGLTVRENPMHGGTLQRTGAETSTRISIDAPASFREVDEGVFEEAIRNLLESPDEITVRALDDIKQGIDRVPTGARSPQVQRIVGEVRDVVRDKLAAVPGYDEAVAPFAKEKEWQRVIQQKLGRPRLVDEGSGPQGKRVNRELAGAGLVNAFEGGVTQADRIAAVEGIAERLPGHAVKERAAGLGFSEAIPTGLVGKNQFFQWMAGLGGAGAVGAAGALGGIPAALLSTGVIALAFIPKTAARVLVGVGQAERKAAQIQQFAQAAVQQAATVGINPKTLTLGQLLERLDQFQHGQTTGIMSRLGGLSLAP